MKQPFKRQLACACGAAGLALQAHAGGFALIEHGVSGLGNAYAGAAAAAHDGSTIWFNPAGMTELDGRELGVGFHVLATGSDWDDRGTRLSPLFDQDDPDFDPSISGPGSESISATSLLPNLYYSAPINERWSYGVGFGAPFGSSTEYDSNWKGRYTSLESGISVLDLNPSVAYRLSDRVRLGGGISLQFLSADLTTAIDSSATCLGTVGSVDPGVCLSAGLGTPGNLATDSRGEITGDSTALSFNIGALFLPREDTRIGVAYRHGASHELDGTGDFTTDPALRAVLDGDGTSPFRALLVDNDATAEVDLPATLMFSVAHELDDRVELLADLTWTGWSSFEELRVEYDAPSEPGLVPQPDTLSLQEWEDVIRVSGGVNFALNERLTLRSGVAFDQEAIPNPRRRTARIPGNDRTWLSFGASYDFGTNVTVDLGYAHLFLPGTIIDNPNEETRGGAIVRGEYSSGVDIFGAQLNWHFN